MTEELQTLLRELAERASFDPVDLASITRSGQVRRRRGAALLGAAAVVAVVATGVGVLATGHGSDAGRTATDTPPAPTVAWASGSTIHEGATNIDVGHPVVAFVRTRLGFVFTDGSGNVWSAVGGQVTPAGTVSAEDPRLVSDETGSRAGWLDPHGAHPVFEVLDQATGQTQRFGTKNGTDYGNDDTHDHAWFYAIDGETAYWHDASGVVDTDLATEREQQLDADQSVLAARDGSLVTTPRGETSPVVVSGHNTSVTLPDDAEGPYVYLSPDARYVATDADIVSVYDVATGRAVPVPMPGYLFADAVGWLDDGTLEVFAEQSKKDDFQLFTCTVPAGRCTVAVDDLGSSQPPAFQLPFGVPMPD